MGDRYKKKTSDVVLVEDVGERISLYNGREYIEIAILGDMVGRKFGEFILTRFIKSKVKKSKGKKKK